MKCEAYDRSSPVFAPMHDSEATRHVETTRDPRVAATVWHVCEEHIGWPREHVNWYDGPHAAKVAVMDDECNPDGLCGSITGRVIEDADSGS